MSLLASRVDYCNAVLYGTPAVVQWSSADYKMYSPPPLVSLLVSVNEHIRHWLTVPYRIQFKIAADF